MRIRQAQCLWLILLLLASEPTVALAQQPKAGAVTTLQGQATVARQVPPRPILLKFKDDVFVLDRIDTRENSIVRVLLGGKALVTVRELSTFTITEEPGRAVVDLQGGKLALAVARSLLKPGESVEVRTPHAIAAVRGSRAFFIVTEKTTEIRVLDGLFEVFSKLAPTIGTVIRANDLITISDKLGPVIQMSSAQRQAAVEGTQAPKPKEHSEQPPGELTQRTIASGLEAAEKVGDLPPSPPLPTPSIFQPLPKLEPCFPRICQRKRSDR